MIARQSHGCFMTLIAAHELSMTEKSSRKHRATESNLWRLSQIHQNWVSLHACSPPTTEHEPHPALAAPSDMIAVDK
eukprot:2145036-Pleurochrysis_carterae.AAC.1